MDHYDPYLHRVRVGDIIAAWAIAVTLVAVLLTLPILVETNIGDTADIGTSGAIADTTPHDTDG